ncbi:50S ribosomal protein L28 [Candidatus Malacoplasma girerdii]|uniref:Large ribosomal subunit protein bL28 n=1 Tax=Candidatus Malacoplasma girerdii TaxID=1318617 RepID=A0A097STM9_9BACT|nr:50S ribosomal protein L28 [Candidatus Malacoplasma girerdii]ASJ89458.1 MAG: 50S ribosomal protein L28 [Candidatus Malacoplasma girerdii]
MSRKDQLTERGQMTGNTRSFAMNHSRRNWKVNLQPAKIKTSKNSSKRVMISTKTLKTLKKNNKLA